MFDLLLAGQAVVFEPQPDIYLEVISNQSVKRPWVFFAPHENEHVANKYVAQQIHQRGGSFYVLRQQGNRLINLKVDQQSLWIDPNRIFTLKGIHASLKKHNPNKLSQTEVIEKGVKMAQKLSQFIIQQLGGDNPKLTWVAMHNNTQGYKDDGKQGLGTISIKRYSKKLAKNAAYIENVNDAGKDEDDLFFITEPRHYHLMSKASFNTVLQHPQVAHLATEDDGSMSVYAEMKGISYINVEAERVHNGFGENHLEQQIKMVNFTFDILSGQQ